jgi:hypothetical protein
MKRKDRLVVLAVAVAGILIVVGNIWLFVVGEGLAAIITDVAIAALILIVVKLWKALKPE